MARKSSARRSTSEGIARALDSVKTKTTSNSVVRVSGTTNSNKANYTAALKEFNKTSKPSKPKQPEGPGGWKGALQDVMESPVGKGLMLLDTPRAYVTSHVADIAQEVMQGDALGTLRAVSGTGIATWENKQNRTAFWAHTGAGTYLQQGINAAGLDDTWVNNRALKIALGLVGDIALDPLTWVGGGVAGSSAKAGKTILNNAGRLATAAGDDAVRAAGRGLDDAALAVIREGAETTSRASTEALASKVIRKGKSAMSKDESLTHFPQTSTFSHANSTGLRLKIPGTGRGGKLLGYKGGQKSIPLLSKNLTNPITRTGGALKQALPNSELARKVSRAIGGKVPGVREMIRSGDPELMKQGFAMQTANHLGNAFEAAGIRMPSDSTIEGGVNAVGTSYAKGKQADAVFRDLSKRLGMKGGDWNAARDAVEGAVDATQLASVKGAPELKQFLGDLYRVLKDELGANVDELDNYFPRIVTDEARAAYGLPVGRNGGAGRPTFTYGRTVENPEGVSNFTMRQFLDDLAKEDGLRSGFYENDAVRTIHSYIRGLSRKGGQQRALQHLLENNIVLNGEQMWAVTSSVKKLNPIAKRIDKRAAEWAAEGVDAIADIRKAHAQVQAAIDHLMAAENLSYDDALNKVLMDLDDLANSAPPMAGGPDPMRPPPQGGGPSGPTAPPRPTQPTGPVPSAPADLTGPVTPRPTRPVEPPASLVVDPVVPSGVNLAAGIPDPITAPVAPVRGTPEYDALIQAGIDRNFKTHAIEGLADAASRREAIGSKAALTHTGAPLTDTYMSRGAIREALTGGYSLAEANAIIDDLYIYDQGGTADQLHKLLKNKNLRYDKSLQGEWTDSLKAKVERVVENMRLQGEHAGTSSSQADIYRPSSSFKLDAWSNGWHNKVTRTARLKSYPAALKKQAEHIIRGDLANAGEVYQQTTLEKLNQLHYNHHGSGPTPVNAAATKAATIEEGVADILKQQTKNAEATADTWGDLSELEWSEEWAEHISETLNVDAVEDLAYIFPDKAFGYRDSLLVRGSEDVYEIVHIGDGKYDAVLVNDPSQPVRGLDEAEALIEEKYSHLYEDVPEVDDAARAADDVLGDAPETIKSMQADLKDVEKQLDDIYNKLSKRAKDHVDDMDEWPPGIADDLLERQAYLEERLPRKLMPYEVDGGAALVPGDPNYELSILMDTASSAANALRDAQQQARYGFLGKDGLTVEEATKALDDAVKARDAHMSAPAPEVSPAVVGPEPVIQGITPLGGGGMAYKADSVEDMFASIQGGLEHVRPQESVWTPEMRTYYNLIDEIHNEANALVAAGKSVREVKRAMVPRFGAILRATPEFDEATIAIMRGEVAPASAALPPDTGGLAGVSDGDMLAARLDLTHVTPDGKYGMRLRDGGGFDTFEIITTSPTSHGLVPINDVQHPADTFGAALKVIEERRSRTPLTTAPSAANPHDLSPRRLVVEPSDLKGKYNVVEYAAGSSDGKIIEEGLSMDAALAKADPNLGRPSTPKNGPKFKGPSKGEWELTERLGVRTTSDGKWVVKKETAYLVEEGGVWVRKTGVRPTNVDTRDSYVLLGTKSKESAAKSLMHGGKEYGSVSTGLTLDEAQAAIKTRVTEAARREWTAANPAGPGRVVSAPGYMHVGGEGIDNLANETAAKMPGEAVGTVERRAAEGAPVWAAPAAGPTKSATKAAASSRLARSNALRTAVHAQSSAANIRRVLGEDSNVLLQTLQDELAKVRTVRRGTAKGMGKPDKAIETILQDGIDALKSRQKLIDLARKESDLAIKASMIHEAEARLAEVWLEISKIGKTQRAVRQVTDEANAAVTPELTEFAQRVHSGAWAELSSNSALYAPRDVADMWKQMYTVSTPEGMKGFFQYYDKYVTWLKKWQIATPGFHVRNYLGGVFNNYLAGVDIGAVSKFFKTHRAWEKGLLSEGEGKKFSELMDFLGGGGQYSPDEIGGGVGHSWKPWATNFVPIELSAAGGHKVEFYLRGALGWDRILKGHTIEMAVDDIAKFHFDYSDLSQMERKIKRVVPFYTWTRYNVPLQLEMLLENPGKYTKYQIIKDNIEQNSKEKGVVPAFLKQDMFGVRLPFNFGGGQAYATPDLPFTQTISNALPDFKNFDPSKSKSYSSLANNWLSMMSPAIKTPIELLKGEQFFKGIPMPKDYRGQTMPLGMNNPAGRAAGEFFGGNNKAAYLLEQLVPAYGRGRRLFPSEEKYKNRRPAAIASFFGVPIRGVTKDDQRNEVLRRYFAGLNLKTGEKRR